MKKLSSAIALLSLLSLSAPAYASPREAAFATSGDQASRHNFLFAGGTLRVGLDGRGRPRPEAALRFTGASRVVNATPRFGEGLALGVTPGAKARLTLAGQDTGQIGKRLQMSGGAKTALIVGGLAVAALVVLFAVSDKVPDDFLED